MFGFEILNSSNILAFQVGIACGMFIGVIIAAIIHVAGEEVEAKMEEFLDWLRRKFR